MSLDGAFRVILTGLGAVGLDPAAVCRAAGLDPRMPDDPALPFGGVELARVLAQAEALSGDPLLGLHVGERAPERGVLAYLARAQATVGDGLEAFAHFANRVWGAGEVVQLTRRAAHADLTLHVDAALPRHAVEFLVARTAIQLRRSRAPVVEVALRHARGGPLAEYERVLQSAVRFGQPAVRLLLRTADLARPLRTANPQAAAALAAGLAPAPAPAATIGARLTVAVEQALARGSAPEREALARALGMSGRTLARRLLREQQRFSAIVDAVRRRRAEELVADSTLALGEVAASLGFADAAAFGKAFRRWCGISPSAYRAQRVARGR